MKLDYATSLGESSERRGHWWEAPLGFVVGVPAGYCLVELLVPMVWAGRAASPGMMVMGAGLVIILVGGVIVHMKRRFLGWLGMGAGLGIAVAGAFVEMLWGWHGS